MSRVAFGEVVKRANTKEDKDCTDKEFYVGGEHIDSEEVLIEKRGVIAGSTIGPMFYFGFNAGQVLFVSRNPHLRKAGMATFDGICSEKTFVLETADENVLLQSYLPFVLQSDDFWAYAEKNKSGSVNFFVNWSTLAKYEFELPTVSEQRRIADLLWAVTHTRAAYWTMIQKTDDLVKSQFVEWFGDPVANSQNWNVVHLCDILISIDGGKSLNCENFPRTGENPAVLKLSAITSGVYNPDENKQLPSLDSFIPSLEVHDGDLLFSRKNTYEYVGTSVYVKETPKNLMLPDLIFRLVPKKECNPRYLNQLINHTMYRPLIQGLAGGSTGSMPNISKSRLLNLEIPLPPLDLQNRFAAFVDQSDKSKFELEQALDKLTATYRRILAENLG